MVLRSSKLLILKLILILFISVLFPLWMKASYAALPKLDQIRVALFIDERGTVPSVTLSSTGNLNIGVRHPSGVNPWFTTDSSIRGSSDQYMIHILETSDYV